MTDRLSQLHVASVRWCTLEAVGAGGSLGATERMCEDVVRAGYPEASPARVRGELDYLESAGLVDLERSEIRPWEARLTAAGRDVVDCAVPAPKGVARPPLAS